MKELLKRLIVGTPLEGAARAVYGAVMGSTELPAAVLNQQYDEQAAALMARVLDRRSNCIDVGCHVGTILDEMLKFAPEGHHFAFEPLPDLYLNLEQKYAGVSNVTLHNVALSEASGEATFQHVVSNPAYSGLRRRQYSRAHEDVVEIRVKLARLDDLLPRDAAIRFVKIDVEGAELQVLRGGVEMLRRCRPFVVFEHGLGAADFYGTRPEMVFDLFKGCGLRLSLMADWLESDGKRALSRRAFMNEFNSHRNFYFLAHI